MQNNSKKKIYSYEHDADLIYTAFLDQYRLDLNDIDYLHWFKFKAMFEGLKSDNKICEIMGYRAIDVSKIKDKEENYEVAEEKKCYLVIKGDNLDTFDDLFDILSGYPGDVYVYVIKGGKKLRLNFKIRNCRGLMSELLSILDESEISYIES